MAPQLEFVASHISRPLEQSQRKRVAFVSTGWQDNVITRLISNAAVAACNQVAKLEVFLLDVGTADSSRTPADIKFGKCTYLRVDRQLPQAHAQIAALGLSILTYAEIGMDPFLYALAFARLAPLQVAHLGHPITSGIPTIDIFISYSLFEGDQVSQQDQYTERLVTLGNLPSYRYSIMNDAESGLGRAEIAQVLGIGANSISSTWYAFPKSIYKASPAMDAVFEQILKGDPKGLLIITTFPAATQFPGQLWRFEKRLRAKLGPVLAERALFVNHWLGKSEWQGLLLHADVLLDSHPYSGVATIIEALSLHRPWVSLPHEQMSGRQTAGLLKEAGLEACCVADNLTDLSVKALQIGQDKEYRERLRNSVNISGLLFRGDTEQAWIDFLTNDTQLLSLRRSVEAHQHWNASSLVHNLKTNVSVGVLLLTCARLDLIARTVKAFNLWNSYPIQERLMTDDSQNASVKSYLVQQYPEWQVLSTFTPADVVRREQRIMTAIDQGLRA
eukprot:gnl/MRDRNA2_/MRDRNA2_74230_c0_seq1.p1 gnl/MRDRNA2_/MRDRNA2_74230_c0~~gnl/MRDRNA2_/MRDRNA2_74230_c0_seq1.p1  ORF type:complete len:503 (+),score=61.98 gnl/MRDRNA2_/MRDRNA2_74230_c0_seq1:1-1509(+)